MLLLGQDSYLRNIKNVIRDIENYRPTSFLNLYYKIYTTILKGYLHYKTDFSHKVALDV